MLFSESFLQMTHIHLISARMRKKVPIKPEGVPIKSEGVIVYVLAEEE